MSHTLRDELILCLQAISDPLQRQKLQPVIKELKHVQNPMNNDPNFRKLLLMIIEEVPELAVNPQNERLTNLLEEVMKNTQQSTHLQPKR